MKAFYSIVIIIGIVGIILGSIAIYVGQDRIRNAETLASLSYTVSNLQQLTNEIASGNFSNRSDSSDKYRKLVGTQRLEQKYKDKGQFGIIIGIIIAVIGLLLTLFGKARYSQLNAPKSK